MEKKKKGKRRNQELAVQEGAESDDTTSMSALNMGGEDSQDPLDNAVRERKDRIDLGQSGLSLTGAAGLSVASYYASDMWLKMIYVAFKLLKINHQTF